MAEPTSTAGPEPRPGAAAASAVAPDPITADLLAKHSAGERLTSAEYGKLGAWKAKLKTVFASKADAGPQPPASPARSPAGVGTMAPAEASGDGLAPVPVDPALCQRTTTAILKRCDAITVRWVEGHARRAGADDRSMARFRDAASLAPADRELISELSPDILAELGVDPKSYPFLTAAGILGLHATNLWLAVDDLKRMAAEREGGGQEAGGRNLESGGRRQEAAGRRQDGLEKAP